MPWHTVFPDQVPSPEKTRGEVGYDSVSAIGFQREKNRRIHILLEAARSASDLEEAIPLIEEAISYVAG